jgi:hypothetical protein
MHELTPDKTIGKMGKLCGEGLPWSILTEIPAKVKWLLVGKHTNRYCRVSLRESCVEIAPFAEQKGDNRTFISFLATFLVV